MDYVIDSLRRRSIKLRMERHTEYMSEVYHSKSHRLFDQLRPDGKVGVEAFYSERIHPAAVSADSHYKRNISEHKRSPALPALRVTTYVSGYAWQPSSL